MNIYFFNPKRINHFKFRYLIEILGIRKVFNLFPQEYLDLQLIDIIKEMTFYSFFPSSPTELNKQSVYSFTDKLIGKLPQRTKANIELYETSKSENPIFNIVSCNDDDNILVLSSLRLANEYAKFANNILRKYSTVNYQDRISYCFIDSYLASPCLIYSNEKKWKSMHRGGFPVYDPLLSYLKKVLIEKFESNIDTVPHFFLKEDDYNKLIDLEIKFIKKEENSVERYSCPEDNYIDYSELDYIAENGGDWIFD